MATKAQKATTQSESPQQQTLPMQYDVRIHSLRLDGNCRAHASVNINGCFAIRGVKVMESSKGLFVSMPSYRAGNGEYEMAYQLNAEEKSAILDKMGQYCREKYGQSLLEFAAEMESEITAMETPQM